MGFRSDRDALTIKSARASLSSLAFRSKVASERALFCRRFTVGITLSVGKFGVPPKLANISRRKGCRRSWLARSRPLVIPKTPVKYRASLEGSVQTTLLGG